ncbi:MAG: hypothetical protein IJ109_07530 [Firmicutes bacterium]|nr:hypothetical protein [Bacillota bacterium]
MKAKNKFKFTKRTASVLVIAILLFAAAGVTGVRAMLNIQSQDYIAEFELSNLNITLMEGDQAVSNQELKLPALNGTYKPGYRYDEVIKARNDGDINVFLRINIRKYWGDENGVKNTTLDPALIKLTYDDEKCGPDWMISTRESKASTEQTTYYYKHLLLGNIDGASEADRTTTPVVNKLQIDGEVVDKDKVILVEKSEQDGQTTYKYEYEYSGMYAWIEADVQALQNHNAQDAIKGLWGLTDDEFTVSTSGEAQGSLSVK